MYGWPKLSSLRAFAQRILGAAARLAVACSACFSLLAFIFACLFFMAPAPAGPFG
jgi:hypothetical protein